MSDMKPPEPIRCAYRLDLHVLSPLVSGVAFQGALVADELRVDLRIPREHWETLGRPTSLTVEVTP